MDRLVRDLLDVVNLDAGRVAVTARTTDPGALLRETSDTFATLAAQHGITILVDAPSGIQRAWCDPDRILQVLSNLVGNAIKFTPEGGRIVLALAADRWGLRFTVTDPGCGIAPERIAGIFDGGRGGDGSRGIGLGLSISRRIVEAHGGAIGVASRPGEGATFWFTLPSAPTRP
jgi:signal transduction histidine kinase